MPYRKIRIEDIIIGERHRKDLGDIEGLAVSIQRKDLLQPILVEPLDNGKYELIAGERRIRAHEKLGMTSIEAKLRSEMSKLDKEEAELDENMQRKDWTWQEAEAAKLRLFQIKQELYGKAVKGHGGGFGLKDMAESVGVSTSMMSRDIALAKAMRDYPELKDESSLENAWKKYQQIRGRAARDEQAKRTLAKVDTSCLTLGKAEDVIKTWKDDSIDFCITDPPYGIDIDNASKQQASWMERAFDDSPKETLKLLGSVLPQLYRVMKDGSHLWMFFGAQHQYVIQRLLEKAGFRVNPVPNIWNKTSQGAGVGDYTLPSAYEPFFFAMKGKRALNKVVSNVFSISRVTAQDKVHPQEKPVDLFMKLIELSSEPGNTGCDLFGGSGVMAEACIISGRVPKVVECKESYYNEQVLRLAKVLEKERKVS